MIYYSPFWLLTFDDGRNAAVADRIEDTIKEADRRLQEEAERFGGPSLRERMKELALLRRGVDEIVFQFARTKLSAFGEPLPAIDHSRMRDAVRRLFSSVRRRSLDMIHSWTDSDFADSLHHTQWENNTTLDNGTPVELNNLVISKVSDFHRNVYDFCALAQYRALEDEEAPREVESLQRAVRKVNEAVTDYCQFVRCL